MFLQKKKNMMRNGILAKKKKKKNWSREKLRYCMRSLTQDAIYFARFAIFSISSKTYDQFDQHGPFRREMTAAVAAAWYRSTMTLLKRIWQTYKELMTPALRRMCTRAFVRSRGMTAEERSSNRGPARPRGDGRHNSSSSSRQQIGFPYDLCVFCRILGDFSCS